MELRDTQAAPLAEAAWDWNRSRTAASLAEELRELGEQVTRAQARLSNGERPSSTDYRRIAALAWEASRFAAELSCLIDNRALVNGGKE